MVGGGRESILPIQKIIQGCTESGNQSNVGKDRNTGTRHGGQDETGRKGELSSSGLERTLSIMMCTAEEVGQGQESRVKGV